MLGQSQLQISFLFEYNALLPPSGCLGNNSQKKINWDPGRHKHNYLINITIIQYNFFYMPEQSQLHISFLYEYNALFPPSGGLGNYSLIKINQAPGRQNNNYLFNITITQYYFFGNARTVLAPDIIPLGIQCTLPPQRRPGQQRPDKDKLGPGKMGKQRLTLMR